ncbi:MAG TPA: tRNA (N(6)-L-threonylcarbamoyladenosine(37)-C(2))-methylthiotransferase MtaB [Spirochaetia bacterium]|nr:tRNA (N(6)-L-threonylcarbamoyladenosine(37)-C(2))-methylthiotransferase MtaB [Spirochaetia bacterium]
MKAGFYTLGCKLAQSESEALASAFGSQGFSVSDVDEDSDLYIVSTCTVTSKAEQKARRMIRKLSREHPQASLIVTGCYAQLERDELEALGDNIVVVPQEKKHILLSLPEAARTACSSGSFGTEFLRDWARGTEGGGDVFSFSSPVQHFHSRAFLKIQDGCNNRCAYCRVPLARGNSVSLSLTEVLRRAKDLAEAGYREIVITGINISAYRDGSYTLADCVSSLTETVKGVRFRLSSLEPDQVDERLASALSHDAVCPHFHIPVQSGSDRVLSLAKRHYTSSGLRDTIRLLREARPGCFIAADIIVGLPGETEEDFFATESLIRELDLAQLHVFPFSQRPGTPFFKAQNLVPERVRDERASVLRALSESLHAAYVAGCKGKLLNVLIEERDGRGMVSGFSENYVKITVSGVPPTIPEGSIIPVLLTHTSPAVRGKLFEE